MSPNLYILQDSQTSKVSLSVYTACDTSAAQYSLYEIGTGRIYLHKILSFSSKKRLAASRDTSMKVCHPVQCIETESVPLKCI